MDHRHTTDELAPFALAAFERAYADHSKRRDRCSRDDFASGYIAALEELRSRSSFLCCRIKVPS